MGPSWKMEKKSLMILKMDTKEKRGEKSGLALKYHIIVVEMTPFYVQGIISDFLECPF